MACQADVLLSTAIVESGLDIPASNTIIINGALDPQLIALMVRDELQRVQRQNGSSGIDS